MCPLVDCFAVQRFCLWPIITYTICFQNIFSKENLYILGALIWKLFPNKNIIRVSVLRTVVTSLLVLKVACLLSRKKNQGYKGIYTKCKYCENFKRYTNIRPRTKSKASFSGKLWQGTLRASFGMVVAAPMLCWRGYTRIIFGVADALCGEYINFKCIFVSGENFTLANCFKIWMNWAGLYLRRCLMHNGAMCEFVNKVRNFMPMMYISLVVFPLIFHY